MHISYETCNKYCERDQVRTCSYGQPNFAESHQWSVNVNMAVTCQCAITRTALIYHAETIYKYKWHIFKQFLNIES